MLFKYNLKEPYICRFSLDVSERSPEEIKRLKVIEETRMAKEAAKKAQKGFTGSIIDKKIQICYNDYFTLQAELFSYLF